MSPDKIRQAVGGGWYERIPVPEKKTCGCAKGEPCAKCKKKAAREASA